LAAFHPAKDFTTVSHLTYGWPLRLVNPGLGAKTVAEETGVRTERGRLGEKWGQGAWAAASLSGDQKCGGMPSRRHRRWTRWHR